MPVEHYQRRNNKINRKRISMLRRRIDYIRSRKGSDKATKYDLTEAAALEWAIRICEQWMEEDPHWVFVPDESGEGGDWRHLHEAFYDPDAGQWLVQLDRLITRVATDEEVEASINPVRIRST